MRMPPTVSSVCRAYAIALALGLAPLCMLGSAAYAQQSNEPTVLWDYQHAVNPATNVRTTGPYDWEDLYRTPNGFPLPGDSQIR
jgi:hypothetical protein